MSQSSNEKDIFRIASSIDSEEVRAAYLTQICGNNAALRSRIEVLLRIASEETGFLAPPPVSRDPARTHLWPTDEQPGESIGPYRLCERIGEGGFGVVYAAEQTEPIQRKVALKIIKPGMDSREVIARFDAERQTLALMDHPHIARVLDAGRADSGRPYFVMELVAGTPITAFCDEHRLTAQQRLQLFLDVCRAVHHAHQKGIIHRDLKPSNVLVTRHDGAPFVKVIDFGVAKALSGQLMSDSVYTAQGQMIGTPLYMSPEQAQLGGVDIDTRSDIYSLGVLLYELLAGTPPFDRQMLEGSGFDQMQRMLRDVEPVKPSGRLSKLSAEERSTIGDRRKSEDRQLMNLLRGELDWIVMKALEKDRNRRYDSAAAMADDIERFLAGDAVLAGPPSPTYRLAKLAYRHRGVLATALLVLLALCSGLTMALMQRHEAVTARKQVEHTLEVVRHERDRAQVLAYAADIRSAAEALDQGDVLDAFETLNRHRHDHDGTDYRGIEWSLLMDRARGTSSIRPISDQSLYTICRSPDGRHLVTAGQDATMYVLDAESLRLDRTFDSPHIEINGLSFSPDGQTLVTTGDDGNIGLWEFASGELLQMIPFGADKCYTAVMTADGQSLIACGHADDVRIFSLPEGKLVDRLELHKRTVNEIALSPDGRLLACASSDYHASVWDWRKRQRVYHSDERTGRVTSVTFSPDGQRLIDGSLNGQVRVTDVQKWRTVARHELGDDIQGLSVSSDGTSLAVFTRTGTLHRLQLDAEGVSAKPVVKPTVQKVHTGRVYAGVWSDAQTLISAGEDGRLGRTVMASLPKYGFEVPKIKAERIAVSPDGTLIAWKNHEEIGLYDRVKDERTPLQAYPTAVAWRTLSFSPDGQLLVAGSDEGQLLAVPIQRPHEGVMHALPQQADMTSIQFSADGRRLAVVDSRNDRVFVLSASTCQPVLSVPVHADVNVAGLSSDGGRVAANRGRDLLVYDVDTGRCLATSTRHHKETISDLRFLPGDEQIVTIGAGREIRLWDWQRGEESDFVGVHSTGKHFQLGLSRDGRTLFTRTHRDEILLWCLPARQRLFPLRVGRRSSYHMDLAGDDSILATIGTDSSVHWYPLSPPLRAAGLESSSSATTTAGR